MKTSSRRILLFERRARASERERERERERNNANLFILAGFVACDEHCLNLLISSMNFGMVLKFMFLANSQTGVLKPNV
jgi:hypothetical protein